VNHSVSNLSYECNSEHDIKEVMNQSDSKLEGLLSELREFRNTMLVYRLLHFNDAVINTDIGLKGRDKELCKPLLQLFVSSSFLDKTEEDIQSLTEIKDSLQKFIDAKHNRKTTAAIETALYPIIVNAVSEYGNSVPVPSLWNSITHTIDGQQFDTKKPNEYETLDYETIYRNTITKLLCDKFGAVRQRHGNERTRMLVFDINKVHKTGAVYNGQQNKIRLDVLLEATSKDSIIGVPSHSNEEKTASNEENSSSNNQSMRIQKPLALL
jgi:hypothetical protein